MTVINNFFKEVYNVEPAVEHEKKNTVYSVPRQGISIKTDPYGGCHVELNWFTLGEMKKVKDAIAILGQQLETDSLWLNFPLPVPAQMMGVLPGNFEIGTPGRCDFIKDTQQNKLRIWHWLNPEKECTIPAGATHNIGATALILDTVAQKVLLVENAGRPGSWNLPGGSFEPGKDSSPVGTSLREAEEEGGFEIKQKPSKDPQLVGQLQFPKNQFAPAINQIWAHFYEGISEQKLNPPPAEIKRAEWIPFAELPQDSAQGLKLTQEIKSAFLTAFNGRGFQEISNKGWMIVHSAKV